MLPISLAGSSGFLAPVAPSASARCAPILMQYPSIDEERRRRSPGIQNNFYDRPTGDFKRPYGGGGGREYSDYDDFYDEPPPRFDDRRFDRRPALPPARDFGPPPRPRGLYGAPRFGLDRNYYGQQGYFEDRAIGRRGASKVAIDLLALAGQLALVYFVLAAPKMSGASSISSIVGLSCIASGGVLGVSGCLDLTSNNFLDRTAFGPGPWSGFGRNGYNGYDREQWLQTEGVYSLCRHPIYAGLIAASVGLGFLTASPERLLSRMIFIGGLSIFLWYVSDREDDLLEEKYGPEFYEWASRTPRFFPGPRALWEDARIRGSDSALGGLLTTGVVIAIFSFAFIQKIN